MSPKTKKTKKTKKMYYIYGSSPTFQDGKIIYLDELTSSISPDTEKLPRFRFVHIGPFTIPAEAKKYILERKIIDIDFKLNVNNPNKEAEEQRRKELGYYATKEKIANLHENYPELMI